MAFNFKKIFENPSFREALKKAVGQAETAAPARALIKGSGMASIAKNARALAAGQKIDRARPEKPASGSRMGAGIREVAQKVRDMGNKKTAAESVVESATKMKKGGMADKSGRAMKRRTADTKGRAMRKGK
jgi:hypothetical protein